MTVSVRKVLIDLLRRSLFIVRLIWNFGVSYCIVTTVTST
jgi:hypothetical protein